MADPFVTMYATQIDPQDVVADLCANGLSSRWPRDPEVVSVLDLEGDTLPTTPADFLDLLRSPNQDSVTFQLWFSDSEDVVVTMCRTPKVTGPGAAWQLTVYLDGAPRPQVATVVSALERFVARHAAVTLALVVDLDGSTEEFDWSRALVDPSDVPVVDSLILSAQLVSGTRGHVGASWIMGLPAEGLATRRW